MRARPRNIFASIFITGKKIAILRRRIAAARKRNIDDRNIKKKRTNVTRTLRETVQGQSWWISVYVNFYNARVNREYAGDY